MLDDFYEELVRKTAKNERMINTMSYEQIVLNEEALQKAEEGWQAERERDIQRASMPFLIASIEKELSEILELLKKAESKAES